MDLLYKLTARVADLGSELAVAESVTGVYDRRAVGRLVRQLDEERKAAVEQLKHVTYFHRQVVWLQERFPRAELEAVPGLPAKTARSVFGQLHRTGGPAT